MDTFLEIQLNVCFFPVSVNSLHFENQYLEVVNSEELHGGGGMVGKVESPILWVTLMLLV